MPRQDFVRVTLDTTTYDQLTALAVASKLTRAEYIRRLIRAKRKDFHGMTVDEFVVSAEAQAAAKASGAEIVFCHGQVLRLDETKYRKWAYRLHKIIKKKRKDVSDEDIVEALTEYPNSTT